MILNGTASYSGRKVIEMEGGGQMWRKMDGPIDYHVTIMLSGLELFARFCLVVC